MLYEIHIETGRRPRRHQLPVPVPDHDRDQETFLYNTGQILSLDSQLEPAAVLLGNPGCPGAAPTARPPGWPARHEHRPAVDAGLRRLRRPRPCTTCDGGGGYSPVSAPRVSTWTSGRSSIWPTCGRSSSCMTSTGSNVFTKSAAGVNGTNRLNVHTIAIQVPTSQLVRRGAAGESDPRSVIGVWTTASRRRVKVRDADRGVCVDSGPFRQVSRLGNPLVNEVLIPHRQEGRVELAAAIGRQGVRLVCHQPGAGRAASQPVPGSVSQPGRAGQLGQATS